MLSDIEMKNYEVILLQTSSSKMLSFVEDTLKRVRHIDNTSTIEVNSTGDLKEVKNVRGITPPFTSDWFVEVDLDKVSSKETVNNITNSSTCFFFATTTKYKNFKRFKGYLDQNKQIHYRDFYLNYLRRRDLLYVYDKYVSEEQRLSGVLFNYLVSGYSNDIDALFTLFEAIHRGDKVNSRKDIVAICGMGSMNVESFLFLLLKDLPPTEMGKKKQRKERLQAGLELGELYGWFSFYNFLMKALYNLIEIKMLKISGSIYKDIKDLPNGYDIAQLGRYQKYMMTLDTIPLSRLMLLMQLMSVNKWHTILDFTALLYQYLANRSQDDNKQVKN